MTKTEDNEYSLEQNGETKSEQFAYDSNTDRRYYDRLVAGSTTTCAIRVVSLIPDHGEVYFM